MAKTYFKIKNLLAQLIEDAPLFNQKLIAQKNKELNAFISTNNLTDAQFLLSNLPKSIAKQVVNVKLKSGSNILTNPITKPTAYATNYVLALDNVKSIEALHLLQEYGVDLNVIDSTGENALFRFMRKGEHTIFRELLSQGMNPNSSIGNKGENIFSFLLRFSMETQDKNLKELPRNIQAIAEAGGDISSAVATRLSTLLATHVETEELKTSVAHSFRYIVEQGALEKISVLNPQSNLNKEFIRLFSFKSTNEEVFNFMLDRVKTLPELKKVYNDFFEQHTTTSPTTQYEAKYLEITRNKIKALEEKILLDKVLPTENQTITAPTTHTQYSQAKKQKI